MAPKAKWTILTYIAAHNNLHYMGKRSYDQIIALGSTPEVRHGILFDWPDGAARYIVGEPGLVQCQEQLGNYDSGDPDRLIETAQWVFTQYPAEHYGLVLWSHGSGWQPHEIEQIAKQARGDSQVDKQEATERAGTPGSMALFRSTLKTILGKEKAAERAICFDDGTGHSLDTLELDRVTRDIAESIEQKLDLIGMDACLMANLEVAYQLRNNVGYMVASEELVPGHSWPYDLIYGALCADPAQEPRDLAARVVHDYVGYYSKHPPEAGDVTKVALDLGNLNKLAGAVNDLAVALEGAMDTHADILWRVQRESERKEGCDGKRKPNKFQFHLWDVGSVVARVEATAVNPTVQNAAQSVARALKRGGPTVLAEGHKGDWFDGIGGVSVFMMPPKKQDRLSPYYARLALSTDTAWDEMLCAYHAYYP